MKHVKIAPLALALGLMACNNEPVADEPLETEVAEVGTGAEGLGTEGQQTPGQPASWDADNDTVWDEAEWTGAGDQGFLGWDADEDDQIGLQEFEAGWNNLGLTNAAGAFETFDVDNNDQLARNELFSEQAFSTWDKNNNNMLERDEFAYYRG